MREKIIFEFDTSYCGLFWDDDGAEIGDCGSLFLYDTEIDMFSIPGIKEWKMCGDKFDPYTDIAEFTTEGRDEWINEGYRLAVEVRKLLPETVDLYYGFWHQFGDSKWCHCKAYIPNY